MTIDRYVSDPARAVVPRFVPLGDSGLWITHHPVEDPVADGGPGLAHLTYAGALLVAAAVGDGARLPSRDEIGALHLAAAAAGTELVPCILPDAGMVALGSYPGDPRMVTLLWCARHDGVVLATMASLARDVGDSPIANAGKHWIGPAPAGLAGLCGWWVERLQDYVGRDEVTRRPLRSGAGFIQAGYGFPHNDSHSDYATTCMLVRDSVPR
jgi:hypothetical protein